MLCSGIIVMYVYILYVEVCIDCIGFLVFF